MRRRTRVRESVLVMGIVLVAAMFLTACGDHDYSKDGAVSLKDAKGKECPVQIAEIQEKKGQTIVYVRGTEDYTICQYAMGKHGYEWKMMIGMELADENGSRSEPVRTTPYMTGKSTGNAMSFVFDGKGVYSDIFVYQKDNKKGGIKIPISRLEIPEDLKMSDSIAKLKLPG